MRNFIYMMFFFSLLACSKGENKNGKVSNGGLKSERLSSLEEEIIDTAIFKSCIIIPLETNENSLFSTISRVSVDQGRIYIFDERLDKICIFNESGKYLNRIQRIGSGPEEYNSIIDFCLDHKNKEIILLCDRPYKIMRFSLDGDFIGQVPFTNLYTEISTDSNYLFFQSGKLEKKYEIDCFDEKMKLSYRKLPGIKDITNVCSANGKSLVKSKTINYTRLFDPSIYHVDRKGISKQYEFDFGEYSFPQNLKKEKDCHKLFETAEKQKYIYSITNTVESDKYILFNTNLGICLYNKKSNKLNGYKMLYNKSICYGSNIFYPNDGSGNSIIAFLDPTFLTYYKEDVIKANPVIRNLVKRTKPDDNPILILYEFR